MTKTIPNVDPDGKYELKAAAEALGIHKATLCKYHRDGLIRATRRRCNRRAIYSGAELIRLWKSVM